MHGSVETAGRALAALAERGRFLATGAQRSAFPAAPARSGGTPRPLAERAGRALLARDGIPSGRWAHAVDADSAARAVEELGGPVAIKVVSLDVTHKSDAGGVLLDVDSPAEARHAYGEVVRAARASEAAERELEALRARLSADGLEVTTQVLHGPLAGTADALLGEAGRVGADLVVIGLSHRTPVGKLVMGSVAQEVLLIRAECPVLTVKAPEDLRGR